jgi:protein-S-isoprenylcysteine O-methyltransferase Ste14
MKEKQIPRAWKSTTFVVIQFLSLGYLLASGPLLAERLPWLILELAGLGLGVWAVLSMGLGNFHIAPDPLAWGRMVKRGPYRFIRHPMYLALLATTLPLVLDSFGIGRLLVWLVLLFTLIFKIQYEEGLLADRFEGYRAYVRSTSRLLPGLY